MLTINASASISPNVISNMFDNTHFQIKFPLKKAGNITQLPSHILEKTAKFLGSEDYSRFRETCKLFSIINPSFENMTELLKEGKVNGSLKQNYEKQVYANQVKHCLRQITTHIESALNNISVCAESFDNEDTTRIIVRYTPVNMGEENAIASLLHDKFYFLISNNCFSSAHLTNFRKDLYPNKLQLTGLTFYNKKMDIASIEIIFSIAQELCQNCKTPEKLVLISIITTLKDYWCQHPLENVSKEEIIKVGKNYPMLFKSGMELQKRYPLAPPTND